MTVGARALHFGGPGGAKRAILFAIVTSGKRLSSLVRRGGLAGALALVVVMTCARAMADVQSELEKGRAAYVAKNYAEAEPHFRRALEAPEGRDTAQTSLARMYLGAIAVAEKRRDDASKAFETLLLDDQLYEPDPLTFPTDVINLFIDTRAQLRAKLNAAAAERAKVEAERKAREEADRKAREAWLLKVQDLATEERTTVRNSRFLALVPMGVGQFQNGQPALGTAFLALEGTLVLGTMVTLPFYLSAQASAADEFARGDPDRVAQAYKDRARAIRAVNLSLAGGLVLTALVGIAQAEWAYVPERVEVKRRPLPPVPTGPKSASFSPTFHPVEGGAAFGLVGRF